MTAFDHFDPFERRITEAIDEIAEARRPEYLDAVLQRTARTAQRPRWLFPERWMHVNRKLLTTATATLVVVLAAGVYIGLRQPSGSGGPASTPSPSGSPGATPLAAGLPTGMGLPTNAPDTLRAATWIANAEPIPGLANDARIRIETNPGGNELWLESGSTGTPTITSDVVSAGPGEIGLLSMVAGGGCQIGDFGRYQLTNLVPDGSVVNVSATADTCSTRMAALARQWARAIDRQSQGGRGVVDAFGPDSVFLITLPTGSYSTETTPDSASIHDSVKDRTLIIVKDPVGFTMPCSSDGGARLPLVANAKAFVAYLGTLPGFTVQTTDLTIDSRPAVLATVPSVKTADCPSGRVNEWAPSKQVTSGSWLLNQGETDVLYLVEVGSDLYLLQWLGGDVSLVETQALLATANWSTSLPSLNP
ncbi:MAG: hypothetical protein ABI555_02340 [Chloroflexota bacterium]